MAAPARSYKKIGELLRNELILGIYKIGDRLPPERDIAERLGVSRTVIREALIMLELENLVVVKKGSGVYVKTLPSENTSHDNISVQDETNDVGPFELLQARQLIESSIAEFAAIVANKSDILRLREILDRERQGLEEGRDDYIADEDFHYAIAEITQNEVLMRMQKQLWNYRSNHGMWQALHLHITDQSYRYLWLNDHEKIIVALQKKDPLAAKNAMWNHLENVKQKLFELSNVEDPAFDGYLFNTNPVQVGIV